MLVSRDNGATYSLVGYASPSGPSWVTLTYDITSFANNSAVVRVAFNSSDLGGVGTGWAIDDVNVTGACACARARACVRVHVSVCVRTWVIVRYHAYTHTLLAVVTKPSVRVTPSCDAGAVDPVYGLPPGWSNDLAGMHARESARDKREVREGGEFAYFAAVQTMGWTGCLAIRASTYHSTSMHSTQTLQPLMSPPFLSPSLPLSLL